MNKPANINDSFFEGIYKEVWRNIIPEGLTEAETAFITDTCLPEKNMQVLDMMCGYGRHALALAANGYEVTALDNQPEYILEIAHEAERLNLNLHAICAGVMEYEAAHQFDTIICMGNSFCFFGRDELEQLVFKISGMLKPGGKMVINSWSIGEIVLRHFKKKDWHYSGPYQCILEYNYHHLPARVEFTQTVIAPGAQIETQKGIDYIYTLNELQSIFKNADIEITGCYSTAKKRPYQLGDQQVYIVLKKSGGN